MAFLVVHDRGSMPSTVPLRSGFRIGRDPACDLCLADEAVSRVHSEIVEDCGAYVIVDLDSRHGVFVNDERVTRRPLEESDRIRIGSTALVFRSSASTMETVHHRATSVEPSRPEGDGLDARRLRLLYDVGRAVGALDDTESLLHGMMDAIIDVLSCERCIIGFTEETRTTRRIVRLRHGALASDVVAVSAKHLEAILVRREAVLMRDSAGPNTPETALRLGIRSAMGVPLETPRRRFGYLYVDDRGIEDRFSADDLDFLVALSRLTAAVLEGGEVCQRFADEVALLREDAGSDEIIGASEPIRELRALLERYGPTDTNVLVHGESGTGKELTARAIHARSPRASRPFVAVNCAAIPDTLIESELFGHEKGAFTGATKDRRGKFVLAHEGTIFLDEVGDLSPAAQAKLLRVIQEREIQPLGSERTARVDVRIVAATHKDLAAEVEAGRFREDLFYRLAVIELEVPPLRARGDDVILLAKALLERSARRLNKPARGFTDAAADALLKYSWPGNVRQLANEMERAAILADDTIVDVDALTTRVAGRSVPAVSKPSMTLSDRFARLADLEKAIVEEAMRAAKGNQSEAARLLGVSRIVLRRRLARYEAGEDA
jgi:Nif-specific regulatory protein